MLTRRKNETDAEYAARCEAKRQYDKEYQRRKRRDDPAYRERRIAYDAKRRETAERRAYERNLKLVNKYGITQDEYDTLAKAQDHLCAICKVQPNDQRFNVDHCHKVGTVRGLLCHHCNLALGHFKDSIESLQNAIEYLQKHTSDSETVEEVT